jgi:hypothetical protein
MRRPLKLLAVGLTLAIQEFSGKQRDVHIDCGIVPDKIVMILDSYRVPQVKLRGLSR